MKIKNFQKGIIQEGIPVIFLVLLLIGIVIFLFYSLKPAPTPPVPSTVTPLPPTVTPGEIAFQTIPDAQVTVKFLTQKWVPCSPPAPDYCRELVDTELPGAMFTNTTDSAGNVKFDVKDLPPSKVEITIEKDTTQIKFQVVLTPYFGAVFVVPERDGKLGVDIEKTEFDPGVPAGEYHGPGTLKADQQASLNIIEQKRLK
jgi:hypothetical protein